MSRMKACPCCKKSKPLAEFGRNRAAVDGLHYYCKTCSAAKQRAWAAKNHEKVRSMRREYIKRMHEKNAVEDPYA